MRTKSIYVFIMYLVLLLETGCKKLIDADFPSEKIVGEEVYNNNGSAIAVVSGVYARMGQGGGFVTGDVGISIKSALAADEMTSTASDADYLNNYNAADGWPVAWQIFYRDYIYQLNSAIEGIQKSTGMSASVKKILIAESKFTRAWLYFNLVNFYGDVPIVLTTDFKLNEKISRSSVQDVYAQIVKDLLESQQDLTDRYQNATLTGSSEERVRPNKLTATALLARVYLYQQQWSLAEIEATKLIENENLELQSDLNQVFLKNNKETIWSLQPNLINKDGEGNNTPDAKWLLGLYGFLDPRAYLADNLLGSFEDADQRKVDWTTVKGTGVVPYKYKEGWGTINSTEYSVVFRLAEQYLIRSEARAKLHKLTGENSAAHDLNTIRSRAGLDDTDANTEDELLVAIDEERKHELFLEWGDRWLNLKRRGNIDEAMVVAASQKGTTWQSYKALLPIPYEEFKWNSSLRGHQNPGYREQP